MNKWWDESDLRCAFNDHKICMEVGVCENCELHPKNLNRDKSSQLDKHQISIDEVINNGKKED